MSSSQVPGVVDEWKKVKLALRRYSKIEMRARELVDVMDRQSCRARLKQIEIDAIENLAESVFEPE